MGIFGNAFTGWHALIILVVVILLFGAAKLPLLAKSVGQSLKIFKNEVKSDKRAESESEPHAVRADSTVAAESAEPTSKP